jgi:hypothetical protein
VEVFKKGKVLSKESVRHASQKFIPEISLQLK